MVKIRVLTLDKKQNKPPYWRFKNELLENDEYLASTISYLEDKVKKQPKEDKEFPYWWDTMKMEIITMARRAYKKVCQMESHKKEITHQVDYKACSTKTEYKKLPKIYFLKDQTGNLIDDLNEVMDRLNSFYKELYSPDTMNCVQCNHFKNFPKIKEDEKNNCDEQFSLLELTAAMISMNTDKAPGIDGVTLEFYHKFWKYLGPILLRWSMCIHKQGSLSYTAAIGVITLLRKPGDPQDLNNWWPITLMTVDCKIVCKVLAMRLTRVIHSLIAPNQTAIPGRSICQNLALIRDMIADAKINHRPLTVLSLDQKKAFDRVNHKYLFTVLEAANFGPWFIKAIKTIYTGYTCVVKNVTVLSSPIKFQRGIRQGDPLSSYLYALALEPTLRALSKNLLSSKSMSQKVAMPVTYAAYADDVTVFLEEPKKVIDVIEVFTLESRLSEAKINITKSVIFIVNTEEYKVEELLFSMSEPVLYCRESIKILGIQFGVTQGITNKQWDEVMDKVWETIRLEVDILKAMTYLQRARWANTKLWPLWLYLLKVLQPTSKQIAEIIQALTETVWIGGRHWVTFQVSTKPIEEGGVFLVSPMAKIQAIRIIMISQIMLSCGKDPINIMAVKICNRYANANLGLKLFHLKPDKIEKYKMPLVYAAAMEAWDKASWSFRPLHEQVIMDMPVQRNYFLLQADPPIDITFTQAKSSGINKISDLLQIQTTKTRLWETYIKAAHKLLEQWRQWSEERHDRKEELEFHKKKDSQQSGEYAIMGGTFVMINEKVQQVDMKEWTVKEIYEYMKVKQGFQSCCPLVDRGDWKAIFKSIAPVAHINMQWRLCHNATPTIEFLYKIKIVKDLECLFCASPNYTTDHIMEHCIVTKEAKDDLISNLRELGLEKLGSDSYLYRGSSREEKLANFLYMAYRYTMVTAIKRIANNTFKISKRLFLRMYLNVINKHLAILNKKFPVSYQVNDSRWAIWIQKDLIAKKHGNNILVKDENGHYKSIDEINIEQD